MCKTGTLIGELKCLLDEDRAEGSLAFLNDLPPRRRAAVRQKALKIYRNGVDDKLREVSLLLGQEMENFGKATPHSVQTERDEHDAKTIAVARGAIDRRPEAHKVESR